MWNPADWYVCAGHPCLSLCGPPTTLQPSSPLTPLPAAPPYPLLQVLDFPVEDGVPILRLGRALFCSDFTSFTWLRAVEFHDHASGWQYAVGPVKQCT